MALAGKIGHHRRFIYATMGDVEMVAVDSRVEGLPGFSHILETMKEGNDGQRSKYMSKSIRVL